MMSFGSFYDIKMATEKNHLMIMWEKLKIVPESES